MASAYRVRWQVQAGLEDVSVWSALVVANSLAHARELIWEHIRSGEMRSGEMSGLEVERVRAPFVHIQKGDLWGEPWSVEIAFSGPLDADQLAILARRLARYEMTQKLGGEAVRSFRLSVPARSEDEAKSRAISLVMDALAGGDHIAVRARQALPVWAWEQSTLDST